MAMVLDTKKSNFGSQELLRLHIWFIVALLKNATNILQNATKTYFKMRQVFYYKM